MQIILLTALAGIGGTGIGGILAILLGKRSPNMAGWMLSFAAGIMIGIVCFGLIPEAEKLAGIWWALGGLVIGIAVIMLLNRIVDIATHSKTAGGNTKIHETDGELIHADMLLSAKQENRSILRSGIIMLIAIALHNFPEGIAVGAAGSHDLQLGLTLAIVIALHNIPEGMAIATPLYTGGMKGWKVVGLTALSGATELLGGVVGLLLGNISNLASAISLSLAGGAMLYVVFGEIIPQIVVKTKNRLSTIIMLFGIIIGVVVTQF